jgi:hypothetical protein
MIKENKKQQDEKWESFADGLSCKLNASTLLLFKIQRIGPQHIH